VRNPFDDISARFHVLVNHEGRQDCPAFIERNRADMRPASLVAALGEAAA